MTLGLVVLSSRHYSVDGSPAAACERESRTWRAFQLKLLFGTARTHADEVVCNSEHDIIPRKSSCDCGSSSVPGGRASILPLGV